MPMVIDAALDAALNRICDTVENLYICSTEPTTFTEASSTYKLGTKATPTINAAQNGDVSGRKRRIAAFTDGAVNTSGTAAWWALTDDSLSELLAVKSLNAPVAVTAGNDFSLTDTDIEFQDPA